MKLSSSREFVEVRPSHLEHNSGIKLGRYTLRKVQMCRSTKNGQEAIVVDATLTRPIVSNILTVFIPTITLLAISFIVRFFGRDYIDMVIHVNLTILLVLATL